MKSIPLTPDTEALARRLVWFEEPAQALDDAFRFIAYALAFQRRFVPLVEDVQVTHLAQGARGFELTTSAGEVMPARQVVPSSVVR